jgi:magnesium transporter
MTNPGTGPGSPRSFYRPPDAPVRANLTPVEISHALTEPEGKLWVDIDSTDPAQHALLEELFEFHPLSIEDTVSENGRVKVEQVNDHLFVVLRAVKFLSATEDPYDLETANIYAFLGANYLVTVHAGPSPSITTVLGLVERSPDVMTRGVGRLMHLVFDEAVDEFFPILDEIDTFIDGLEERVFHEFDQAALEDIFAVKRLVLSLRRYLMPQREIFNTLAFRPTPLLQSDEQVYFRDVYDHVLRINDSLETYRELLSSTMDSYLSQVSNRLSHATKGLSLVATISIPFVVISGMYGMNFQHIPLAQNPHGFWWMLGLQAMLSLALMIWLRYRKLI